MAGPGIGAKSLLDSAPPASGPGRLYVPEGDDAILQPQAVPDPLVNDQGIQFSPDHMFVLPPAVVPASGPSLKDIWNGWGQRFERHFGDMLRPTAAPKPQPKLVSIDHDPFSGVAATGPRLTPIDHDPFAGAP